MATRSFKKQTFWDDFHKVELTQSGHGYAIVKLYSDDGVRAFTWEVPTDWVEHEPADMEDE